MHLSLLILCCQRTLAPRRQSEHLLWSWLCLVWVDLRGDYSSIWGWLSCSFSTNSLPIGLLPQLGRPAGLWISYHPVFVSKRRFYCQLEFSDFDDWFESHTHQHLGTCLNWKLSWGCPLRFDAYSFESNYWWDCSSWSCSLASSFRFGLCQGYWWRCLTHDWPSRLR